MSNGYPYWFKCAIYVAIQSILMRDMCAYLKGSTSLQKKINNDNINSKVT